MLWLPGGQEELHARIVFPDPDVARSQVLKGVKKVSGFMLVEAEEQLTWGYTVKLLPLDHSKADAAKPSDEEALTERP